MNTPSTPYLQIDSECVDRNIARLAAFGREHTIGIRPHTKTHKSLEMARRQLAAGAIGLTVAKPGEAEIMAETGADLLVAYPVVDPDACRRVAELARSYAERGSDGNGTTFRVAVDSAYAAHCLSAAAQKAGATLNLLVDLDVGPHRTGVQSPRAALELAQEIERVPGLTVGGLFCYPGHVWHATDRQAEPLKHVAELLEEAVELFRGSGIDTGIVSGGSTPSAYQSHLVPQFTEIRPGTSIYNDRNTVAGGFCEIDDCAARIIATVVSDAVPGQVVVDAGSKTLTTDRCIPQPDLGFGYVVEYPEAKITALSEEHGQVDISQCAARPKPGERVTIIPNHICPCVNLHDRAWLLRAGATELEPLPTDTRGKIW